MMWRWAGANSGSAPAVGAPGLGFRSLLTDLDCVGVGWVGGGEKP